MDEFAEIEPGGFKIEFTPHETGACVVSIEPKGVGGPLIPGRIVRTVNVVVNNTGTVLEMNSSWNSPFLQTHATYLVSDKEGLFGRLCPFCKSYFRTNSLRNKLTCPYCTQKADCGAFTTANQRQFMYFCCKAVAEAIRKGAKSTFDIVEAIKELPNNRPAWVYTEESQQHIFSCNKCTEYNAPVVFNILGEFGSCPSCGNRNYREVFEPKIQLLETQFLEKDSTVKEPHRRAEEWKSLLVRCVSEFESVANDIRKQLLKLPLTQKRRNDLGSLSFQRVQKANDCIKNWFGIEMFGGFPEEDAVFLNKMFNRRHLVIHAGSRVDEEYLRNTNDASVRLNQVIRIDSSHIRRLIPLTKITGLNLIAGYESIQ